ncbi:MAG: hypothetical protein IJV05_10845 [Muribaculaceae bacterium]|nr:hypothetical protein [Muribaculaceae bacterium]
MKKTILTLALMLMMALTSVAAPTVTATPASGTQLELKNDSVVVTDGDKSVTMSVMEMEKINQKIKDTLGDTLAGGSGTTVEIDGRRHELTSDDVRVISSQWAVTSQFIACATIAGLLALVLLVLFFRFLNRRNKYRVIEKAIENNYPLNELSLGDVKHSAIYVQQPVVQAPPVVNAASAQQPGQVPVGSPIQGQTASNPIVMTDMVNWRALMPAVKWIGWGACLVLFSIAIGDARNPFWPIGLALMFVGVCKGFILYKEQKALQQAWSRAQQRAAAPQQEPMREGIPVPPPFDEDYKAEDNAY